MTLEDFRDIIIIVIQIGAISAGRYKIHKNKGAFYVLE